MLDALGPDAMAIDVLGKRGTALGRTAANISPEARETLESALLGRKAGQNERIVGTLEEVAGLPAGSRKTVEELQRELYKKVEPEIDNAYEAARAAGFDLDTKSVQHILDTPLGKAAYADALKSVQNRQGVKPPQASVSPSVPKGLTAEQAMEKLRTSALKQERRVLNRTAPAAGPQPARPQSLREFVAGQGGILDFNGEAAAVAGGVKTRNGRVVRDDGRKSLDSMREAAEEAGYLGNYTNDGMGVTNDDYGRTSIADFLKALDDDVRGERVFARENLSEEGALEAWEAARDARDNMRGNLDQIGQNLNGTVSDDVIARAGEIMQAERLPPDEALQRAIDDDVFENGIPQQEVPAGLFADPRNPGAAPRNYSNLARLDETRKVLDDKASAAFRSGEKNAGSQAADLARALRQGVDQAMTGKEYAIARALRQKAYGTERAVELGADLARGRVPASLPAKAGDVFEDDIGPLRQAYALQQAENLLNRGSTDGALNKLSTPLGREAYEAALGDKASAVAKALNAERTFNATARDVTGNSSTARQLAEMAGGLTGGAMTAATFGMDATTGGVTGALLAAARRGAPALRKFMATKSQKEIAPHLAEILIRKAIPVTRPLPPNSLEALAQSKREAIARALMATGVYSTVGP